MYYSFISGSNILLDAQNNLKLSDFGVSKPFKPATSYSGTVDTKTRSIGTPNNSTDYSREADIWLDTVMCVMSIAHICRLNTISLSSSSSFYSYIILKLHCLITFPYNLSVSLFHFYTIFKFYCFIYIIPLSLLLDCYTAERYIYTA